MPGFPIRFTPGMRCTDWRQGRAGTVTSFGRGQHGRYVVTLEDAEGTQFHAYTPHLTHERVADRPTISSLEHGYAELHADLTAHAATCDRCADQLKSGRPVSCYIGRLLRTDLLDLHCAYEVLRDGTPEPPQPVAPVQETLWPIRQQPQATVLPERHARRPTNDPHLPA